MHIKKTRQQLKKETQIRAVLLMLLAGVSTNRPNVRVEAQVVEAIYTHIVDAERSNCR